MEVGWPSGPQNIYYDLMMLTFWGDGDGGTEPRGWSTLWGELRTAPLLACAGGKVFHHHKKHQHHHFPHQIPSAPHHNIVCEIFDVPPYGPQIFHAKGRSTVCSSNIWRQGRSGEPANPHPGKRSWVHPRIQVEHQSDTGLKWYCCWWWFNFI